MRKRNEFPPADTWRLEDMVESDEKWEELFSQAKEEAARILERARMEAELEKQKMADNMKKEMISIASLMAGKVVSATVDTAVQNRLIEETLQEIGESTWQS